MTSEEKDRFWRSRYQIITSNSLEKIERLRVIILTTSSLYHNSTRHVQLLPPFCIEESEVQGEKNNLPQVVLQSVELTFDSCGPCSYVPFLPDVFLELISYINRIQLIVFSVKKFSIISIKTSQFNFDFLYVPFPSSQVGLLCLE